MRNDMLRNFAQRAKRRLVGKENVPTMKIKVISNDDEEFRNKVEDLLSRDEVVSNPMHYLIDDKIFSNMNEIERERYLLSTLDKFSRFREQIENAEHASSYNKFCMWNIWDDSLRKLHRRFFIVKN